MKNKDWPRVLAINTYAGSLLIGARLAGANVYLSLEDAAYGMAIAKWNFLETPMIGSRARWPEASLGDAVVIAHPPCAAFSVQGSTRKAASGLESSHFKETEEVLEYAMRLNCRALLIESVVPALEGAFKVHNDYAARHGYRILRILQNAATFGLAQWRARFWIVFLRADADFPRRIPIGHTPRFYSVGQMMNETVDLEPDLKIVRELEGQLKIFTRLGLTDRQVTAILDGSYGYGHLQNIIKRYLGLPDDLAAIAKKYCYKGSFMSYTLNILDPVGFVGTLLYDSFWYCQDRLLTPGEYRALMGFPRDYLMPGKAESKFREYLSRGVCPPVAAWLLAWLLDLCVGKFHRRADHEMFYALADGEVADFNMKKKEALRRLG